MMEHAAGVEAAIYLMQFPSQVRLIRSRPLPDGIPILLRIAAADEEMIRQAAEWVGRPPETIRQAAAFFIEQILLYPEADSYRVLGATPGVSNADLRCNMALLLKWLHPDLVRHGERSLFARRVTLAWNDLKTQERRDDYDRSKRLSLSDQSLRRKKSAARTRSKVQGTSQRVHNGGRNWHAAPRRPLDVHPSGLLRRLLLLLLDRFAL